ncbi:hypothetical protein [Heyndrickxia oleronia]|nr:hypothetical protein [Heyndrickxia oleronia]
MALVVQRDQNLQQVQMKLIKVNISLNYMEQIKIHILECLYLEVSLVI